MARILVVDDEEGIRRILRQVLEYEGHDVRTAGGAGEAFTEYAAFHPELTFLDVKMARMDGLEVLDRLREEDPQALVVMISGHGSIETAVEATRRGAYDFLEKPLDTDRLLLTIRNALQHRGLEVENARLRGEVESRYEIVGNSYAIRALLDRIEKVGPTDARVLITGENGTGKELVARALHAVSSRRDRPFVSVNMAAITHTVAQSALFGHVRGAFTGAARDHAGYFGEASGGTIFLDEVGATSWEIQAMLLRVLETGEAQPVGSPRGRRVDVRLLAATDADLSSAVEAGTFRRALYHRLSGYQIHVPPLRRRRDDIGRLLHHFLAMELGALGEAHRLSPDDPSRPGYLSASLVGRLLRYGWPGNVRELHNVVRRLVVAGRGRARLGEADLGPVLGPPPVAGFSSEGPRAEVEGGPEPTAAGGETAVLAHEPASPGAPPAPRSPAEIDDALLLETLRRFDWRTSAAARHLGISRTTLYAMIERSPRIRAAKDVPDDELRRLFAECEGDLRCVARRLEVSERGLKLRLRRLGLG